MHITCWHFIPWNVCRNPLIMLRVIAVLTCSPQRAHMATPVLCWPGEWHCCHQWSLSWWRLGGTSQTRTSSCHKRTNLISVQIKLILKIHHRILHIRDCAVNVTPSVSQSEDSPCTRMHCYSLWVSQSSHNVSSGFVCDFEGRHHPVGACSPKQNLGGPVVSHGINCSNSVACQNLLDWERTEKINKLRLWTDLLWNTKCNAVILSQVQQIHTTTPILMLFYTFVNKH